MNKGIVIAIVVGIIIVIIMAVLLTFGRTMQSIETHFNTYKLNSITASTSFNSEDGSIQFALLTSEQNPPAAGNSKDLANNILVFTTEKLTFGIKFGLTVSDVKHSYDTSNKISSIKYKYNSREYEVHVTEQNYTMIPLVGIIQIKTSAFDGKVDTMIYKEYGTDLYARYLK